MSAALEPGTTSLDSRLERIAEQSRGARRYTILGEVARGGMGKILRAWDESLSREVAMKVVPRDPTPGSSEDERADHERRLARFIEEAHITAQLDHPGIVPVYEVGLDEKGSVFFTMPLVRGQNLKRVFEQVHRGANGWNLQHAVDVMHTVCLTLAFAHSKGVVHRDLKPENIMVGPFGEAYVMDWGLALLLGRSRRDGIVGTPAYMSPEQGAARHELVGPCSDVYSLGAILYELFARRMPHELSMATDARAPTLAKVIKVPPRPLSELDTDVPPELAAICEKAMSADPERRYANALEMAEDLSAWLGGRAVRALGAGTWVRVRKWRSRNRGFALALDALALLSLAGGTAFLLQERSWLRAVEAKHREALSSGYAANLSAADLGLRAHESEESKRRLEACDEELRGWEWRHLELRADSSQRVLLGHEEAVRAVAVSPDGRRIASCSDDASILLWDASSGTITSRLLGHEEAVTAVAFSPDGARLASASRDDTVRLWDAAGVVERVIEAHGCDVSALAFSPDGMELYSGDVKGNLVRSSVESGDLKASRPGERNDGIVALDTLLGSGSIAAAYVSGLVRLLEPANLELVREEPAAKSALSCLRAAPDGKRLAVACDRGALLLDGETLAPLLTLTGHGGKVNALAFSPDSRRLATAGYENVLRVFDLDTGRLFSELNGHEDDVNAVAFFPDGSHLVTGAEDDSVRVWNLERSPVVQLVPGAWIDSMAFSPDGNRIASGSRDRVQRIFDVRAEKLLSATTMAGFVDCVAWSARDELAFGCGDPVPRLASPATPSAWKQLPPGRGYPRTLLFDRAGTRLLWRDSKGFVSVLDLGSEAVRACVDAGDDSQSSLALSPDGSRFAAGAKEGEIGLWDTPTGERVATLRGAKSTVTALAFSPDGELLAAGHVNRSIVLVSTQSGAVLHTLDGHDNLVSCLAFSPDGTRLVSGSYDRTLRVWSPSDAVALLTLHGHTDDVTAVSFDPSGEVLASASKDGTIRLWYTARSLALRP